MVVVEGDIVRVSETEPLSGEPHTPKSKKEYNSPTSGNGSGQTGEFRQARLSGVVIQRLFQSGDISECQEKQNDEILFVFDGGYV